MAPLTFSVGTAIVDSRRRVNACQATAAVFSSQGRAGVSTEGSFLGKDLRFTSCRQNKRRIVQKYFVVLNELSLNGSSAPRKEVRRPVIVGVGGDSGCGKSTFTQRLADVFGAFDLSTGHTPVGEYLTSICLDDYHLLDRQGRKEAGVTALNPVANNFDLMYEQIKALKNGEPIQKPIYNHKTGIIEGPETIYPNHVVIVEGLHPMYDERVRNLLDLSLYIDVDDHIKYAWKIKRDVNDRGHKVEDVLKEIEQRKPDFAAYVDPQKEQADIIMQILPTKLIPDDDQWQVLRVRLVQREGAKSFSPVYLIDEGSTFTWIPCGRKLTCTYPGIRFFYGPDVFAEHEVSILEMDGNFERVDELMYVEQFLKNTSAKYFGEMTQQVLKNETLPGSRNGSGLMQVLVGFKLRRLWEKLNRTARFNLNPASLTSLDVDEPSALIGA
mmetsp:Transcript_36698/g.59289  ORF Transcript_36698/g.59289 Transcript_36698/m.59289 type:complete len:440 (+) Transcript_36698:136-1455(+)